MRHLFKLTTLFVVACSFSPSIVLAQINGFNFLDGFTFVNGEGGTEPTLGSDFIQITNGFNQRRSVWFDTRQPFDTFSASFNYQAGTSAGGLSFIIQDDSRGRSAVTNSISGPGFNGIDRSFGVVFTTSAVSTFVSIQSNGAVGSGSTDVELSAREPGLDVSLDYDGRLLAVTIDDGTNDPFSQSFLVSSSIAETIGSGDAFIGFGASTSNYSSNVQRISDFQFSSTMALMGDVSLDNTVNFLDISPMIALLTAGEYQVEADINRDGSVDFLDISPFITILSN